MNKYRMFRQITRRNFDRNDYFSRFVSEEEGCKVIKDHLTSGEPAAHITLGDGECLWLSYPEILSDPQGTVLDLCPTDMKRLSIAGMHQVLDSRYRLDFKSAVSTCPYFCMAHNWRKAEFLAWWTLVSSGLWDNRLRVPCHSVLRLNDCNSFFPILEGRRVFVVAGHASELCKVLSDKDFRSRHEGKGIVDGYEIVGHITAPWKDGKSKTEFIEDTKRKLKVVVDSFDLLITSAGTCSIILCDYAKKLGKVGFDIGQTDLFLLGRKDATSEYLWDVPESGISKMRG